MNRTKKIAALTIGKRKKILVHIGYAIGAIAIFWALLTFISNSLAWKAVFLDSNQVFFGRFISIPFSSTITLHDAYYLKSGNGEDGAETLPNLMITSVEDDAHAPFSKTTIRKSHILYYQKLRPGTTLYKGLQQESSR